MHVVRTYFITTNLNFGSMHPERKVLLNNYYTRIASQVITRNKFVASKSRYLLSFLHEPDE